MQPTIKLSDLIDNLLRVSNQGKLIPLEMSVREVLDFVHLDDYKSIKIPDEVYKKLP